MRNRLLVISRQERCERILFTATRTLELKERCFRRHVPDPTMGARKAHRQNVERDVRVYQNGGSPQRIQTWLPLV